MRICQETTESNRFNLIYNFGNNTPFIAQNTNWNKLTSIFSGLENRHHQLLNHGRKLLDFVAQNQYNKSVNPETPDGGKISLPAKREP
jgi:hypothetical protein